MMTGMKRRNIKRCLRVYVFEQEVGTFPSRVMQKSYNHHFQANMMLKFPDLKITLLWTEYFD